MAAIWVYSLFSIGFSSLSLVCLYVQHGAAVVQDKLYIYGGNHNGRYLNDLHVSIHLSIPWSYSVWLCYNISCEVDWNHQLIYGVLMERIFVIGLSGWLSYVFGYLDLYGNKYRFWIWEGGLGQRLKLRLEMSPLQLQSLALAILWFVLNIKLHNLSRVQPACSWLLVLILEFCGIWWWNFFQLQIPWGNKLLSVAGHSKDPSESIQGIIRMS